MIPLQSLQDLALDPTVTEGPAIVIIGILALFGLAGIRFRSPLVMVAWLGMVLAIFLTVVVGVSFISFWIATMITAGTIALATVIRWATGAPA